MQLVAKLHDTSASQLFHVSGDDKVSPRFLPRGPNRWPPGLGTSGVPRPYNLFPPPQNPPKTERVNDCETAGLLI